MAKLKLEGKSLWNVHQLVFLANEYPNKKVTDFDQETQVDSGLVGLMQLPLLDLNIALWNAEELGWLFIDKEANTFRVEEVPDSDQWQFSPEVKRIQDGFMQLLAKKAETADDFAEQQLNFWLMGYSTQDQLCAIRQLLDQGKIKSYKITNTTVIEPSKKGRKRGKQIKEVKDTYTFYSLPENAQEEWGRKQFTDQSRLSS